MAEESEAKAKGGHCPNEKLTGREPWIYRPEMWCEADKIAIHHFRQILIWPLILRPPDPKSAGKCHEALRSEAIKTIRRSLDGRGWTPVTDPLKHLKTPERCGRLEKIRSDAQSYAEFVYFHDFVQQMLFHKNEGDARAWAPFTLHRRQEIAGVEFDIGLAEGKVARFTARVERCNLYLFASGAAILALEIDFGTPPTVCELGADNNPRNPRPMTLADVQTFTDFARRAYAPFFYDSGNPAFVPLAVRWLGENGEKIVFEGGKTEFKPAALDEDFAFIRDHRTAPAAAHWQALLSPLCFAGYEKSGEGAWRQVVDERIPVMSFLSLTGAAEKLGIKSGGPPERDDLWVVKRGDWIRLCYADRAGTDPLPYSPVFLQDFERDACYDRYFPSEASGSSVRYLIAGFHFAAVGAGGFFDNIAVHHFRRHYFQMGLVLHMEFAAMLSTSSRITEAVSDLAKAGTKDDAERSFRSTMIDIERDFLQFVHRFHFPGLSNQMQANELFQKWRCALGIDRIFADLKTEIETATQFALALDEREETSAASRLTAIATIGAVLGLTFTFLSIDTQPLKVLLGLIGPGSGTAAGQAVKFLLWVAFWLAAFAGGGLLLMDWLRKGERPDRLSEKTRKVLQWICGVAAVAFVVLLLAATFQP